MCTLNEWARKHGVGAEAIAELESILTGGVDFFDNPKTVGSSAEADVQKRVMLQASKSGARMWRNNVGAFKSEGGSFVRYGLANESAAMNKVIKSSDLIGITPIIITPDLVGARLGVFTAYEVKREDWVYSGRGREKAQRKYIDIVVGLGGIARFVSR